MKSEELKASDRDRRRRIRQQWKLASRCIGCGREPRPGKTLCEPCGISLSQAQQRYRVRAEEAAESLIVVERMPINSRALRTCPICGVGDIVTIAQYGGDRLPSCAACARDEEPTGYPLDISIAARAVLIARTCPGLTSRQIADEMGAPVDDRYGVTKGLSRGVKSGAIRHNGAMDLEERRFYRTEKEWRPTEANVEQVIRVCKNRRCRRTLCGEQIRARHCECGD